MRASAKLIRYWFRINRFLEYYLAASTIFDIHSPRLFRLVNFALDRDRQYLDMARLRVVRDQLSRTPNPYQDGSVTMTESDRDVRTKRNRMSNACCKKFSTACLFRLAVYFQPKLILHLGGGNGLDSLYLKKAAGSGSSLLYEETSLERKNVAHKLFDTHGSDIKVLNELEELDQLNHRLDMVVFGSSFYPERISPDLVSKILDMTDQEGAWIITGIHEDAQRFQHWLQLKNNDRVTASFRCWSFGILFFSPGFREKLDFTYIPWQLKPWRIGLWGRGYTTKPKALDHASID